MDTTRMTWGSTGVINASYLHKKNLEHEKFLTFACMLMVQVYVKQHSHIILWFTEIQHYKLTNSHCEQGC